MWVWADIWYLDLLEYAKSNNDGHFFHFWVEILFLGKFGFKIQSCLFKVKFGTYTNSNMRNSMTMFGFSVFDQKYQFD